MIGEAEYVIADPVVASVAARAALDTPGVVRLEPGLRGLVTAWTRAARGRWQGWIPRRSTGCACAASKVGCRSRSTSFSAFDQPAAVGRAVQRSVTRVVAEQTGLAVDAVVVSIVDIELERR
ncbi:hypothetical protein AB0F91_15795 [Amycolatopsis sp. NPDC023774]|uniref:hypothetical protein n=1 Tax=Amycolatopsis sp. NPDC023774 TaxID=3155015 RepID=UPI00340DF1CE